MANLRLLFAALLGSTVSAQISDLQVLSATNTQIQIQFTDAVYPSRCTVEVSESDTYWPVDRDVDPGLFSGSNACDRAGSVITGSGPYTVQMILGTRRVEAENAGSVTFALAGGTASAGVVSWTAAATIPIATGETVVISGASVSAFNGTFQITADPNNPNQFTVSCAACANTATGGTATRQNNYSRALQAHTLHFVRVTDNGAAAITAATTNIPNGVTFADVLQVTAASHRAFLPSLPDTTGYSFPDPFTGALVVRAGLDADTTGGAGHPIGWSGGSNKMCATSAVSGGYYCATPTTQGMVKLYWVNTASGESNFLGVMKFAGGPDWAGGFLSPAEGNWDSADPSIIYKTAVNAAGKTIILQTQYTGGQSAQARDTFITYRATNLTPSPGNTLTDLLVSKTASYPIPFNPSHFPDCSFHGVQAAAGHTYAVGSCRRYQQDSPAWVFVVDLGSKRPPGSGGDLSVVAAGPMFANRQMRWCGLHSQYYVGDQANTVMVPQQLWGGTATGPYSVRLTARVDSASTDFSVSGEPATSGSGIAPDGDATLMPAGAGDLFQFQDGSGEYIQISAKVNSSSWTVRRGCHVVSGSLLCDGTRVAGHPPGAEMWPACTAFIKTDTVWWSFLGNSDLSDSSGIFVIPDTHQVGHQVTRAFPNGNNWNIVEDNGIRHGAFPGQYSQNATRALEVSPKFAGVSAFSFGNSVQKHPSYDQAAAPAGEQVWYTDQWPWSYNGRAGSAALVPGRTNIYRFTPEAGDSFSIYKLPYFGLVGSNILTDVSGVGSVLADAPNYELCIANAVDECFTGSQRGEIYVSSPTLTHFGCKQGETQPGPGVRDLCIQNTSVYTQAVPQLGLLPANQTGADPSGAPIYGAGLSRALTYMIGGYRQSNTGGNAHALSDGAWIWFSTQITDPGSMDNMVMVKVPPQPGADGVDRSNFIPVTIPITTPQDQGITRASIHFWYGEYGYANQQCTQRREQCNVTQPSIQEQPFNFVQTDEWTGQPCAVSCSITLPLLPNHIMQYQVRYLDNDNQLISAGPIEVVADQFNPDGAVE